MDVGVALGGAGAVTQWRPKSLRPCSATVNRALGVVRRQGPRVAGVGQQAMHRPGVHPMSASEAPSP